MRNAFLAQTPLNQTHTQDCVNLLLALQEMPLCLQTEPLNDTYSLKCRFMSCQSETHPLGNVTTV